MIHATVYPRAGKCAVDVSEDRQRRDETWDAETIRQLRRHAGLSQQALAEELNARQQTVSEWERGAYVPRGTAARLLTRVAEDVAFPFQPGDPASDLDEDQNEGEDEDDGQT
ncbi:MAG: helix-turn-helix domain-containing protein [Chloroflexi bacterium]|nr:helix-turn-helix domain-containing protein [Chloroflexota bacterium]MYD17860.1 helix-turn-helix domain-containing protein [Chloroflexota bacterium]MYJ01377.1 helix-turn-helix domain-containing protein [Chloroflexota bacterium]